MLFLAQLVAPPLQPGPVRLPSSAPQQRPKQDNAPLFDSQPGSAPGAQPADDPETLDKEESLPLEKWRPDIQGKTPYSDAELITILSTCGKPTVQDTLNACAAFCRGGTTEKSRLT